MKRLPLLLLAALPAFAQCPTGTLYPGALDTNASLTVAKNNITTTLTVNQQPTDTVAIVASTTGWTANMMAAIDTGAATEYEFVTSVSGANTLNVSRACDSSTAVQHIAGAPAVNIISAYSGHTSVTSPITAIETLIKANPTAHNIPVAEGTSPFNYLAPGASGQVLTSNGASADPSFAPFSGLLPAGNQLQLLNIKANTGNNTTLQFDTAPFITPADVNFPSYSCNGSAVCTQGGTNGLALVIGNNSLTMNPVPQGVNGTDSGHYLYVSGGTGTAEACFINGGAGTAGQASGVIIINCANTHSGAWTLVSATAGIQEELQNAATTNGSAYIPPGTYTVNGRISLPANVSMIGAGPAAVNIVVNTSSGANTNEITTIGAGRMEGFTVTMTGAATMNCIELDSFGNGLLEKINCLGGQDGIRVNLGSGNSNITDVQVNNQSRNGFFVNADSSGEVRFTRARTAEPSLTAGAVGFLITKTTTTDLGGIYLQNCLANDMGSGGLVYNATAASPMPLRLQEAIFDTDTTPIQIGNVTNVSIIESWINATGVSVGLTLNNVSQFVIAGNTFIGVGSAGINFQGTVSNGTITGNTMAQVGTVFNFVSSPTVSGILFRGNNTGGATVTSSIAAMATASAGASSLPDGPQRVPFINQSASLGATNFITAAPASQYRLSWYTVITQAATTSSSLNINLQWNDGTATNTNVSPALTANTLGAFQTGTIMINSAAAQNILFSTTYASTGATPMKYSVWFTVEQL